MKALFENTRWIGLFALEAALTGVTILFLAQVVVVPAIRTSTPDHDTIERNQRPFAFATEDPFWRPLRDRSRDSHEAVIKIRNKMRTNRL